MRELKKNPTAKVSVRKSLLKKYKVNSKNAYFLKNDAEFEIELFNPLTESILCKISFNGKNTNNDGLVLRPGERIFLERYLDTNNKFLFETYEVEDTKESKNAIIKNGLVRVTFHKEREVWNYNPSWGSYDTNGWYIDASPTITIPNPDIFYCHTELSNTGTATDNIMTTTDTTNIIFTSSAASADLIETGRVEKGDGPNQSFTYVNQDFEIASFSYEEFTLLPEDQRPKTTDDLKIRTYCTQCGKKARPKDKFCSACGTKIK